MNRDGDTTTLDHPTAATALEAVQRLAPAIASRAAEVEAARRLPTDLIDELRRVGCFGLLLPPSHGGAGADLPGALRVLEALARADASVGWTVMVGGGSWVDLAHLPRATFDALFAGKPGAIVAGAINPSASIAPSSDGARYRVNGRWGFASGCEHADWIFGNCVEGFVDGAPLLRIAVFEPEQVVIEDTWYASGLRGTGSHHFHADDVMVPAERTADLIAGQPCLDETVVRVPPPALLSLQIASVAVGTAQGALDDVTALAEGKVPLFDPAPLATNRLFQFDLATARTELRAARALLYNSAEAVWTLATQGTPPDLEARADARAAAAWVTHQAAAVVDSAYRSSGGSGLYDDSPLQRRLRDIHAVTQHFLVKRDTLTTAGAVFAGQEPGVPVF